MLTHESKMLTRRADWPALPLGYITGLTLPRRRGQSLECTMRRLQLDLDYSRAVSINQRWIDALHWQLTCRGAMGRLIDKRAVGKVPGDHYRKCIAVNLARAGRACRRRVKT